MKDIRLSFIIPVYNGEKTVSDTLSSVASQTVTESCEVIAVNDGSTDSTLSVLESWKGKILNYRIISIENGGVSNARNIGIKEAKGEYLSFVDADDLIDSTYAEKMLDAIGDGDITMCNYRTGIRGNYREKKELTCFGSCMASEDFCRRFITATTKINTVCWRTIYRTSLISDNGIEFDSGIKWGEDQEFVFRCLLHTNKISFIDDVLYTFTMNPESVTHRFVRNMYESYLQLNQRLLEGATGTDNEELIQAAYSHNANSLLFCIWNTSQPGTTFTKESRKSYIREIFSPEANRYAVRRFLKHPDRSPWSFVIWPRLAWHMLITHGSREGK